MCATLIKGALNGAHRVVAIVADAAGRTLATCGLTLGARSRGVLHDAARRRRQ